jgi:NADH-quinone oxidoreductase E subunit
LSTIGKLSETSIKEIKRLKSLYPHRSSAVLMVLHVVNDQFGYLDKEAMIEAATIMELPYIDFEQAGSFYTLFSPKPVGKYHIQVCRTLACHLRGAEELASILKEKLRIGIGGTTEDGLFSLTEVECLGSCGSAPVMQINDTYYENLTRQRVDEILADLRKKAQND